VATNPSLAEQLRDAIRQSGESLNQLSRRCGIGRDRLSRFVRGERDLTVRAAAKICATLDLVLAKRGKP
jgi:transcriptional regulator with XRE-family HTH domain